jgi:hypothetical protein
MKIPCGSNAGLTRWTTNQDIPYLRSNALNSIDANIVSGTPIRCRVLLSYWSAGAADDVGGSLGLFSSSNVTVSVNKSVVLIKEFSGAGSATSATTLSMYDLAQGGTARVILNNTALLTATAVEGLWLPHGFSSCEHYSATRANSSLTASDSSKIIQTAAVTDVAASASGQNGQIYVAISCPCDALHASNYVYFSRVIVEAWY